MRRASGRKGEKMSEQEKTTKALKAGQTITIDGRKARLIYKIDENAQTKKDLWLVRFLGDASPTRIELPH